MKVSSIITFTAEAQIALESHEFQASSEPGRKLTLVQNVVRLEGDIRRIDVRYLT